MLKIKKATGEELRQLKREENYEAILEAAEDIGVKKVRQFVKVSKQYLAAKDRHDSRQMAHLKVVYLAEAQDVLTIRKLSEACIECLEG